MTGLFFEDLEPGQVVEHGVRRTVTEADNVLFCSLTMNPQPLHLDEQFAAQSPFGRRIVNGIFTMGLVVGITVPELTAGTIVANLGYQRVQHPRPLFHGDTIRVETEVLEKRPSRSRPSVGIVKLRHRAFNQNDELVCELDRTVMFRRRSTETGDATK